MKQFLCVICSIVICLLCVCPMAGCGERDGTYYPPNDELQANLERNGYITCFTDSQSGWGGYATKGEDFLYFVRPIDGQCDFYYETYQNCKDYDVLVKIENDKTFGNIVYCGTTAAVEAAGIRVVKVDVTVKV